MITIRYDDGTLQISHRWISPIQVDASLVEFTRQYFGNGKNTKMSQRLISRWNRKLVGESWKMGENISNVNLHCVYHI